MLLLMFPYIGFMSLVALAGAFSIPGRVAVAMRDRSLLNIALILYPSRWARPCCTTLNHRCPDSRKGGVMLGGLFFATGQLFRCLRCCARGCYPHWECAGVPIRAAWADPRAPRWRVDGAHSAGRGVYRCPYDQYAELPLTWPRQRHMVVYADRLMEVATALLRMALSVNADTPFWPGARSRRRTLFNPCWTGACGAQWWCCRCLCTISVAVCQTLGGRNCFTMASWRTPDVGQIAVALAGYGAGLLGLVAVKVLAPGCSSQDVPRSDCHRGVGHHPDPPNAVLVPLITTTRGWPLSVYGGSGQRCCGC